MPRKRSKQAPGKVSHAFKVHEALHLRRSGASYEEIGKATDVNASTAWRRVRSGLKKLAKLNEEEAEHVKSIELSRLDFYLRSLDSRIRKGDPKAINAAIRISARRAKLLGIEAPKEVDLRLTPDLEARFKAGDPEAVSLVHKIAGQE